MFALHLSGTWIWKVTPLRPPTTWIVPLDKLKISRQFNGHVHLITRYVVLLYETDRKSVV